MTSMHTKASAQTNQIALLIDADNVAAPYADQIVKILSAQGELRVRRVYGNWQKPNLQGWQDAILRHALQPMQQYDYCKGKNATDMALTVDAMDLLYTHQIAVFAIVSSDCDFTPLVQRLRRAGKTVLGFGNKDISSALVKACDRFYPLDQITSGNSKQPLPMANLAVSHQSTIITDQPPKAQVTVDLSTDNSLKGDTKLINSIRQAIGECQDVHGWAKVQQVGVKLGQVNISSKDYGYANLSKLLAVIDLFELRQQDAHYWVKDKRQKSVKQG